MRNRLRVMFQLPGTNWWEPPSARSFRGQVVDTAVGSWSWSGAAHDWLVDAVSDRPGRLRVRVDLGGEVVLTGPVTDVRLVERSGASELSLTGADDMALIQDAQAHPEPTSAAPSGSPPVYGTNSHDARSGIASTVVWGYVDANAGPSATPGRVRVAMGADPVYGGTVDIEARWINLLSLVQAILLPEMISATCVDRTFVMTPPADQSADLILSTGGGGTALAIDYSRGAPGATFVYGLGGGELTARRVSQAGDTAGSVQWQRRIERLKDRRDLTSMTKLAESVQTELALRAEERQIRVALRTEVGWTYGVDYGIGTLVTVATGIGDYVGAVRSVTFNQDRGRSAATVELGIGSPSSVILDDQSLTERLNSLEGSQ